VPGFRFSLYSEEWDELGEFETIVPNWFVGDAFLIGDGRRFRITGIVPVDAEVAIFNALWRVEPVKAEAPTVAVMRSSRKVAVATSGKRAAAGRRGFRSTARFGDQTATGGGRRSEFTRGRTVVRSHLRPWLSRTFVLALLGHPRLAHVEP
jgi:hypothetical protein